MHHNELIEALSCLHKGCNSLVNSIKTQFLKGTVALCHEVKQFEPVQCVFPSSNDAKCFHLAASHTCFAF